MSEPDRLMGPQTLEARLRQLEAIHHLLGQEIAALRRMQKDYGLGSFSGTFTPSETYGSPPPALETSYSLTSAAAQPDLLAKDVPSDVSPAVAHEQPGPADRKAQPKRLLTSPTRRQFEEAKNLIMEGYVLDRPEDADRMLKTLVFRILDGGAKGFRSADLPSARIVAMRLIEDAGLNPGPGFSAAKLRSLLKKYVRFEPITSIRRQPR